MAPDAGVLVAACVATHPRHVRAHRWLRHALADCANPDNDALAILPMVAVEFLRVVTRAVPPDQALAFLDSVLLAPGVTMPATGREWPLLEGLCLKRQLGGPAIPDAWIAATAMQQGLRVATFDPRLRALLPPEQVATL